MKFTDGMTINTDGPYRLIRKSDGLYVTGKGMLCPVDTAEEGTALIRDLTRCKPCKEFFSRYRCNKPLECDCPKCQGYCECEVTS